MATKIIKFLIFIFFSFIFVYIFYMVLIYKGVNPKERNVLSFKSSVDSVEYEVNEMDLILSETNKKHFIFGIDEENVLFTDDANHNIKDIGVLSDTSLHRNKLLNFIDLDKRKNFVEIAKVLNDNFLTRCNEENGNYIYLYRANIDMGDRQKDLMRYVIFAKDIKDLNLSKYKVLDNKDDLYLLAYKNAEIWEN